MNEPKSSRYHRLRRRASVAAVAGSVAVLAALLWARPELPTWRYVLLLVFLNELVALPLAFLGGFALDRKYELSAEPASAWLRDHAKAFGIGLVVTLAATQYVYALIGWMPANWWIPAAASASVVILAFATLAPLILLPLFYRFTALERPALRERLLALSEKAGVPVLGVFEWGLGAKTRRANAALTGSGRTRRILLSDTLLAEYSDDEIEVVLAHELAHHVHRDIPRTLLLECGVIGAGFLMASVAIEAAWRPLGLSGPGDIRGLPVLLLAGGAVMMLATPLVNALSRKHERRADEFALVLTGRSDAFVSAMRRLGSQNLVEESPSKLTVWLFHTHPPVEDRIQAARTL